MKKINTPNIAKALVAYFDNNQAATARALGVKQPTVHGWISGQHKIAPKTAIRIEKATNGKFKAVKVSAALAEILESAS